MFARTQRLLLRPGFPEDAPALLEAIGDEQVARHLPAIPWPFGLADAEALLMHVADPLLPSLLIVERTGAAPRLVGGCRLSRRRSGAVEIGFWVARSDWGRGIAGEAAEAVVGIARALRLPALDASHFLDNPRPARVLEKLGFNATGLIVPRFCRARGEELPARLYRMRLACCPQVMPAVKLEETLAA